MKIKLIALVLLIVLVLAGCNKKIADSIDKDVIAEQTQTEDSTLPPVYEYETVDGGIRILSHYYDEEETQIELPEEIDGMKVVSLGPDAFYQHKSVASITLTNNVKSLEGGPFYRCYSLKELVIPASVEKIDGNPVFRCSSLENITVHPDNLFFSSVDGILFNKEQTKLIAYPEGKTAESYTIPETVKELVGATFGYHTKIKKLTIPESVTVFPDYNMFVYPEDIVLYVEAGSAAENYAKEYELQYEIIE